MKRYLFHLLKHRHILYSLLILLPSLVTGNVYHSIDDAQSTESLVQNLSAITGSLATTLSDTQNYTAYRLKLLLSHTDFTSFNIEGMGKLSSEFLYRSPAVKNIYILDSNRDVVYGTNDTLLSGIGYTHHIDSAYKGTMGFCSSFVDDMPFAQFAVPIYSDTATPYVVGVICLTYNFQPMEMQFKALNSYSVDLQGYLFDTNGHVLISSSNQVFRVRAQSIDINLIKQGIAYSPDTTFTLFDETPLIGCYHTIPGNGWTVLLTATAPDNDSLLSTQLLSLSSGCLGIASLSTLEIYRKRKNLMWHTASLDEAAVPLPEDESSL